MDLEQLTYYHIYNRGNNSENLFYNHGNYDFFLQRILMHCYHVFETYAYCLMPNHFHMLISVRHKEVQNQMFKKRSLKSKELQKPSKHLSNFFSSYTQSINNQQNRTGSLFQKNFKRKEIDSDEYFRKLIIYIHQNPVRHGFTSMLKEYPYSSYQYYLKSDHTFLNIEKALSLFGGLGNFLQAHEEQIYFNH